MIFEEKHLKLKTFRSFSLYLAKVKVSRSLNIRALKYFSKSYKKKGFNALLLNKNALRVKREQMQKVFIVEMQRDERMIRLCFREIK
jgi:hypothetical protein